jgi:hypothetical protein
MLQPNLLGYNMATLVPLNHIVVGPASQHPYSPDPAELQLEVANGNENSPFC